MAPTLIDLTQPLDSEVPVYPGDPPFSCRQYYTVPRDGYSVHALSCSSHVGTHVDAPSHFLVDGATVDQLSLSTFILPALVLDVSHMKARQCITWDTVEPLAHRIHPGTALGPEVTLLLCTGWSQHWGRKEYMKSPHLSEEAAKEIMERGVRVVGIDVFSVDGEVPEGAVETVHRLLLGNGILIVENLTNVEALLDGSAYLVSLLPLKLQGCDGSPIRAVAWKV
ncbi:putative cyclase [Russula ochroleuca]|uniref:Cyclase n=1 Tax=Russula ochroleuca TaxID=152965 RepID=A0A9P5N1D4_9AGAM|nr:putative cyclase [Russula ochroleuca]